MPRFTAEQIYASCRQAGFSPDQSATMTAIALAESGGDSRSHATVGEDSRGLWQINAAAHPDLAQRFDLYDPAQNAQAAFIVSHGGQDVSPWTVTHGGLGARYLRFKDEAQAAAAAYGDGPNHGVWTGTAGYGHPLSAGRGGAGTTDPHTTEGSDAVVVNHGAIPGTVAANGIHVNAYFGDVTGNGTIDGLDLATVINVGQGKDTGFAAYRLLDPAIVGDVANDFAVDAGDISTIAAFIVHLPTAVIPVIPTGLTIIPVDPNLMP